MYLTFLKTEEVTLNLDPEEFVGCSISQTYLEIQRELGKGNWDERDITRATDAIHKASKETGGAGSSR